MHHIALDHQKIKSLLLEPSTTVEVLATVTSTNDQLQLANSPTQHVCIAEQQTQGRGRLGKPWHSPHGTNIYMSYGETLTSDSWCIGSLSLAIALTSCMAIEKTIALPQPLQVKWPNDIWYDNKKLGGILLELITSTNKKNYLAIGAGINVNMINSKNNIIDQGWTSLRRITQSQHDRNIICANLINAWQQCLLTYQQNGFTAFNKQWNKRDALHGKHICLQQGKTIIEGTMQGINSQGHLQVELADQSIKTFTSGEARLLPNANNNPSHQ